MTALIAAAALGGTLASALLLYAGSAHCHWRAWRVPARVGSWGGLLLAALSLLPWSAWMGPGAGLCAMLGSWMLVLMLLPWLSLAGPRESPGTTR